MKPQTLIKDVTVDRVIRHLLVDKIKSLVHKMDFHNKWFESNGQNSVTLGFRATLMFKIPQRPKNEGKKSSIFN